MVADIHRTLLYGGIFLYPADKKVIEIKKKIFNLNNILEILIFVNRLLKEN